MAKTISQKQTAQASSGAGRLAALLYSLICYGIFLGTFLYALGFVGDIVVPKSIDSGPATSLGATLAIDLLLLNLFAIQHSGMARPAFKRWWTQIVPRPIERSTYVLLSSLVLLLLFWQWRALPGTIWQARGIIAQVLLYGLAALGWLIVLISTFLINHFDMFGLRQTYLHMRGQPYSEIGFRMPLLYKIIRHPIILGFIIAFWATPHMTIGHLLFAAVTSAYMLLALQLEERDLLHFFGDTYRDYRRRVPMLIPWLPKK